jgi:ankyrin repeat protein
VARLLIDAGADVHGRDLLLDTPLHLAAIWGNEGTDSQKYSMTFIQ